MAETHIHTHNSISSFTFDLQSQTRKPLFCYRKNKYPIYCFLPPAHFFYKNNEDKIYFPKSLPSSGTTVRATVFPASLISCTMSLCDSSIMDWPFTAEMRSPTFSRPLRSVGLPSMMRPILWGITGDREINGYFIYTY